MLQEGEPVQISFDDTNVGTKPINIGIDWSSLDIHYGGVPKYEADEYRLRFQQTI
jgi:hypothetical protein